MDIIQFSDRLVPYEVFLNDIASKVVSMLNNDSNDPEYVSQRQAFRIFGRANVERWRTKCMVTPHIRPGKVEYKTSELRLLQRKTYDLN